MNILVSSVFGQQQWKHLQYSFILADKQIHVFTLSHCLVQTRVLKLTCTIPHTSLQKTLHRVQPVEYVYNWVSIYWVAGNLDREFKRGVRCYLTSPLIKETPLNCKHTRPKLKIV